MALGSEVHDGGGARVRWVCRCAAAGVAATLVVYVVLFTVSFRTESFAEADWMASATGRLHPDGAGVAESGAAFAHTAAQAVSWIAAFGSLPLVETQPRKAVGVSPAVAQVEVASERVPLRQAG